VAQGSASYSATATMPNFKLSNDDARDVSAFLIAASTSLPGDTIKSTFRSCARCCRRSQPYGQSFCASCHAAQNARAALLRRSGSRIDRRGTKAKPEWMKPG